MVEPTTGRDLGLPKSWITAPLSLVFFFSGSASLMYEVVWTHQFSTILGSTSESMTLVFAVFLALLALGGWVCGKSRRMAAAPLLYYSLLESGIAVAGVTASFILLRYDLALVDVLPTPRSPLLRILASLVVVTCLIGPATFLMGGTLPLMTEAVKRWYLPSRQITLLYGFNTAGAALGALVPGLISIPRIGLSGTALAAMLLNLSVAITVLIVRWKDLRADPTIGRARLNPLQEPGVNPGVLRDPHRLSPRIFGLLAFASGFTILLMELCWGRLAKLVLGNRTLAISVLLCSVLTWLGIASLAHRSVVQFAHQRWKVSSRQYIAVVLASAAMLQLICGSAAIQLAGTFGIPYSLKVLSFLAVMAPPFFAAGLLFPWLLAHFPSLDQRTGASVGFLYATNVVGSTLGAILTTFVLVELCGTALAMLVGSGLLLVAALGLSLSMTRVPGVAGAMLILGVTWAAASWLGFPKHLIPVPPGEKLIAYRDDRYGIQILAEDDRGVMTALNNNVRLVAPYGEPNTTYAQHLQADLPMLLASETSQLFNIGTGFGITAGAFTLWRGRYDELVSVEILPFMVENQPRFKGENYAFYERTGTRFVQDDGRHLLLSSGRTFDVLSVNPIDPRLPGSSSLCTVDFWARARGQLRPGGVYAQLVWGPQTKMLVQAFAQVFPQFLMFRAYRSSYVLVGYNGDQSLPPFHLERLTPEVRAAYARLGIEDPEAYFGVLRRLAETDTERWREQIRRDPEPRLHSNDFPILEYSLKHAGAFRVPDEEW